jgi:PE family
LTWHVACSGSAEVRVGGGNGLANTGSTISEANAAAAFPTSSVLAAGGDEVSAGVAALFGAHAQAYQALSAQAASFHQQFVQLMNAGAAQYLSAEAASAGPLQTVEQDLLGVVNAPTLALFNRPLIGNGVNGTMSSPNGQAGGFLFGNGGNGFNGEAGTGGLAGGETEAGGLHVVDGLTGAAGDTGMSGATGQARHGRGRRQRGLTGSGDRHCTVMEPGSPRIRSTVARCAAVSMSGVNPSMASANHTVAAVGQSGQVRGEITWYAPMRGGRRRAAPEGPGPAGQSASFI